jgi:hypothetical protein
VTCLLVLMTSASIRPAAAQTFRGGIQGSVIDASGAFVGGAAVTVSTSAIGLTRSLETDETGQYFFTELPVGEYTVAATRSVGIPSLARVPDPAALAGGEPGDPSARRPRTLQVSLRISY